MLTGEHSIRDRHGVVWSIEITEQTIEAISSTYETDIRDDRKLAELLSSPHMMQHVRLLIAQQHAPEELANTGAYDFSERFEPTDDEHFRRALILYLENQALREALRRIDAVQQTNKD